MTRNLKQTLRQRQRQNFTRKQKGGGFFEFFKTKLNIDIPIGQKVSGFFSNLNPFTRKKTIAEKITAVPNKVMTGVRTGVRTGVKNIALAPQKIVNNIPGVAPKRPFGGTRKRKQRKN